MNKAHHQLFPGSGKINSDNLLKTSFQKNTTANLDTLSEQEFQLCLKEVSVTSSLRCNNLMNYERIELHEEVLSLKSSISCPVRGTCRQIAKRYSRLSEAVIYVILDGVLNALQYLHSHQIIHRAVQGSHIVVGNTVLLTGLQFSSHLKNHQKCHSLPPGIADRLPWASPELLRQDRQGYNHKTDIYSLGITILELLAGFAPFEGFPNTKIYLMKLSSQTLLPFSQSSGPSSISKRLVRVIDKCVQYNPESRSDVSFILKSSFFVKMKNKCIDLSSELSNKYSYTLDANDQIDNNIKTNAGNGDSSTWVFN